MGEVNIAETFKLGIKANPYQIALIVTLTPAGRS